MIDNSILLSDQVFQLNTFLWALEDLPVNSATRPVLREAGYRLRAIGQQVIGPADEPIVSALGAVIGSQDRSPSRPDLWLRHDSEVVDPVIELKAQGFSPDSSSRKQALKIIASAADLSPSLAESTMRPGHVIYATNSSDAPRLSDTLRDLSGILMAEGIPTAPTGAIGFSMKPEGVTLSSPRPSDLPDPMTTMLASPTIVL